MRARLARSCSGRQDTVGADYPGSAIYQTGMAENWQQGGELVKPLAETRVAIVHEWLFRYTGSEQVVAAMLEALPQADLYALLYDPEGLRGTPLEEVSVKTSFIQSLPGARKKYQTYLPLMPLAVEQFDLSSYDIIISSNHAVAKGVLARADQLHVSYVYTPLRYAWDLYQDYLVQGDMVRGTKSWLA